MSFNSFGSTVPFCEPLWYSGAPTPYYKPTHVAWRKTVRDFVEEKIVPFVDDWIQPESGGYPNQLHLDAYEVGINGCLFPKEYGGAYSVHTSQAVWPLRL